MTVSIRNLNILSLQPLTKFKKSVFEHILCVFNRNCTYQKNQVVRRTKMTVHQNKIVFIQKVSGTYLIFIESPRNEENVKSKHQQYDFTKNIKHTNFLLFNYKTKSIKKCCPYTSKFPYTQNPVNCTNSLKKVSNVIIFIKITSCNRD